jgi:hypothetical protein
MPDISTINNVAVADISKLESITFAHGQKVNNQDVSLATDAHTLIATATASGSATLEFTSGIDSTYDVYEFHMVNMHPANNNVYLAFQVNAAGESGFNEVITSTFFYAWHHEGNAYEGMGYGATYDQAEGTAYQALGSSIGNASKKQKSGVLTLYDPSSTTFVKHFTATTNTYNDTTAGANNFVAGYINTTAAIDEISFKMITAGNIDAGVIKMFGVS